jgi:O-antigen/teichoic acid export membrane protein
VASAPIGLRSPQPTRTAPPAVSSFRAATAVWTRHRDLLRNAGSLLASTGVTSALGFTFWAFAAREFSQQAVGYGSAAVSAMTLLGTVGVFGLGTVLIGELPRRSPRAGLVSAALLACGVGSLLLGLAFAVGAPLASKRFEDLVGQPAEAVTFAVGVALTAVTSVFDQATIGLLRGGVQLARNLVFAITKMAVLPATAILLHDQFGAGITVSWIAGIAVSMAGSAIWLGIRGCPVLPRPDWAVLRALGKSTLAHNWLNLAIAVPITLLPVLVTVVVSPAANAVFYVAWMITSLLTAVPVHLSTVLFAIASADPQIISRKLRFALKVSLWVGVPGVLVLCVGGHFVLSLFGSGYTREATFPLRILALSYVPGLPKTFYVAVSRAAGRVSRAAVVLSVFAATEMAAVMVSGALGGLRGVAIAILVVIAIEGLATTPAIICAAWTYGRHRRVGAHRRTYPAGPAYRQSAPFRPGPAAADRPGRPGPVLG